MQNFSNYLETKRIVTKKRVPYYVAWVSQFFDLKTTICWIWYLRIGICDNCYLSETSEHPKMTGYHFDIPALIVHKTTL